jgi:hypothetical protein
MAVFAGRRMNIDTSAGMPGSGKSIELRMRRHYDPFRCFRSDGQGPAKQPIIIRELDNIRQAMFQDLKREWKINGKAEVDGRFISFDPKKSTVTFQASSINYVIVNLKNLEITYVYNDSDPAAAKKFTSLSTGLPLGQKAKDKLYDLIMSMKNTSDPIKSVAMKAKLSETETMQLDNQFVAIELLFNFLYRYGYHK